MTNCRTSSGCFIFHNENPKGRVSSSDCVIRAIAKATGKSWEDVLTGLFEVGLKIKDVPSSKPVFQKYLEQQGYRMQRQPRKPDATKYTVEEFANKFSKGAYIVNLANRLSCVVDGKIYDTWNCKDKSVGNYWKVK